MCVYTLYVFSLCVPMGSCSRSPWDDYALLVSVCVVPLWLLELSYTLFPPCVLSQRRSLETGCTCVLTLEVGVCILGVPIVVSIRMRHLLVSLSRFLAAPYAPLGVIHINGNYVSGLPSGIAGYYIALHHRK